MYTRKTKDTYFIYTNYGYGWEQEDEARRLANEYRATSCAPLVRVIKKRVAI